MVVAAARRRARPRPPTISSTTRCSTTSGCSSTPRTGHELKADFSENTYYPADLEWRGLKLRNVGIRSRGLGTRNEFKPGLRVDMNRYASGQRFLGMRAVLLDNVYRDISGIRERVAMKLFARFGLPVPREAHARLSVNGEYAGVYVITEELGEDFVRRVFKKPESGEPDQRHALRVQVD